MWPPIGYGGTYDPVFTVCHAHKIECTIEPTTLYCRGQQVKQKNAQKMGFYYVFQWPPADAIFLQAGQCTWFYYFKEARG
jgi:hypothetical protein